MSVTFEAVDHSVEGMLRNGYGQTLEFLGDLALSKIVDECDALIFWRRDQKNRGTGEHRVFVPNPRTIAERILYKPRSVPGILNLGNQIEDAVQVVGQERSIPLLKSWTANHIVVNKMHAKRGVEAVHSHSDPEYYSGLLAVVSCAPALLKFEETDMAMATEAGSLETFIGSDLADLSEGDEQVGQVKHAVEVNQDRYSIIYANDTRLPQTFAQIARTQLFGV